MKSNYKAPLVSKTVSVELEQNILAGSVITHNSVIESQGTQVEKRGFDESGFNHTWE